MRTQVLDEEILNEIPDTLPNVLSDCIEIALQDLAKAEASDKYVVDMGTWHRPTDDGKCQVCLAGSIMAFTINNVITPDIHIECTSDFPRILEHKLDALDSIRSHHLDSAIGNWLQALKHKYRTINHPYNLAQEKVRAIFADYDRALQAHGFIIDTNQPPESPHYHTTIAKYFNYKDTPYGWRQQMEIMVRVMRKHGL
jgi:hypothetical protein